MKSINMDNHLLIFLELKPLSNHPSLPSSSIDNVSARGCRIEPYACSIARVGDGPVGSVRSRIRPKHHLGKAARIERPYDHGPTINLSRSAREYLPSRSRQWPHCCRKILAKRRESMA